MKVNLDVQHLTYLQLMGTYGFWYMILIINSPIILIIGFIKRNEILNIIKLCINKLKHI